MAFPDIELLYLFLWNSPEKFCIIFGMLEDKLRDIVKQRIGASKEGLEPVDVVDEIISGHDYFKIRQ